MRKYIETYGIKKIEWTFNSYELEEMVRKHLQKEFTDMETCPLVFKWKVDEEGNVETLTAVREFKFQPNEEE